MYRPQDHELIVWEGTLYRRVPAAEAADEKSNRHLFESDLVATEDLTLQGRVIKAGEVIPPPSLTPGLPVDISVYFPPGSDGHDHLLENGKAKRVTNVNKLIGRGSKRRGRGKA